MTSAFCNRRIIACLITIAAAILCALLSTSCASRYPYVTHNGHLTLITPQ